MSARNAYSPRLEIFTYEYPVGVRLGATTSFIVVHVRVARICCDEPSSAGDPAAGRENRHVARILPARDRVRQPKELT